MNQTLLIELLTEELPPKALAKLGEAFASGIVNGLKSATSSKPTAATALRLAPLRVHHWSKCGRPDKSIREKVLPVPSRWTPKAVRPRRWPRKLAALGRPDAHPWPAGTRAGRQGRKLLLHLHRQGLGPGRGACRPRWKRACPSCPFQGDELPAPVRRAAGETVHFVRPAHALALLGDDVVPINMLGLDANVTLGHRFLSSGALQIAAPTPTPTPWPRKARSSPASPSAAKRSAPRCWPRRRRPGADARIAAGRSDRPGRMAGGLRMQVRG
jgi:glycyl-tRNA synthetase beta chain